MVYFSPLTQTICPVRKLSGMCTSCSASLPVCSDHADHYKAGREREIDYKSLHTFLHDRKLNTMYTSLSAALQSSYRSVITTDSSLHDQADHFMGALSEH